MKPVTGFFGASGSFTFFLVGRLGAGACVLFLPRFLATSLASLNSFYLSNSISLVIRFFISLFDVKAMPPFLSVSSATSF